MNHSIKISVLLPAYNAQEFLAEAIDSILQQTYTHFELLIINDGSTDATEKIILSYKDERIVYIKNEQNIGLIASLNKGIDMATGEFIARMDADDVSMSNRLELQLELFKQFPNAVVVGSDYYLLQNNQLTLVRNISNSDYQKAVLLFSTCFCHPTVMIKNIFKEKYIAYDKSFIHSEDYKLWTDLAPYGDFLNVNIPLLKYRSHNAQISARHKTTQLQISRQIRLDYLKQLHFTLSDKHIETLNIIGNNEFITTKKQLKDIEQCLLELQKQNNQHSTFNNESFNLFLHKFWNDSCGYTNLGMRAFNLYNKSMLSKLIPVSGSQKLKLLVKCMVRTFRSN